jgi:hypothetical protein
MGLTLIMPFLNSTNVPLIASIRIDTIRGVGVGMPLYGNVKVRHVVQDEVDELLIAVFADEFDE